ncbi:MAG: PD-(D/E)XK nuclease family protein [Patescibacteria group bacterium]
MTAPLRRKRNIFTPAQIEPYRISRSKIELFLECPRCFYLDRRLGVARPSMPAFALNLAVDALLKREFDQYRRKREPHPLMVRFGIHAIPFAHPDLDTWRENFKGVEYFHTPTNFLVCGAPDDVWIGEDQKLIVVDYKATSTVAEISMEDECRMRYKRQIEIYQWLLRKNGFEVSETGYFLYVNADKQKDSFDQSLHFAVHLFPYAGSDTWVDEVLGEILLCLKRDQSPPPNPECEWCRYRRNAASAEHEQCFP